MTEEDRLRLESKMAEIEYEKMRVATELLNTLSPQELHDRWEDVEAMWADIRIMRRDFVNKGWIKTP